jgi:hypothetical protein
MCTVYDTSTVLILAVGHDVSVSVCVRVYNDNFIIKRACVHVCMCVHMCIGIIIRNHVIDCYCQCLLCFSRSRLQRVVTT